jgi:hypothetical protein
VDVTPAHSSFGDFEVLLYVHGHKFLVEGLKVGDVDEFTFLGVN